MSNPNAKDSGKENKPRNLTGFRRILDAIARDLWVVILDVVAVNLAYLLVLLVRAHFMENVSFTLSGYPALKVFVTFTPIYTVLCVLVFALCRLYNGMWRYAGINDMNRILLASAITAVILVAGTLITARSLSTPENRVNIPTGYWFGIVLQFIFIVLIRFVYRIFLAEKKKLESRKLPAVNVMIVGAGEAGRKAVRQLEDSVYRPACIIDSRSDTDGKAMDGIPVLGGTGQVEHAVARYAVSAVIIADPTLSAGDRESIKAVCDRMGLDLQDQTGLLVNLSGRLPLTALLEAVIGPVSIRIDGQTTHYDSGMDALASFNDRYTVTAVCAEGGYVRIDLKQNRTEAYAGYEAWLQKHKEETGEEVSYF